MSDIDDPDHPYRYITELEAEIERLRDEAAINETVIHGLRANRDDAEDEIERLRAEIAEMVKLGARSAKFETELAADNAKLRALVTKMLSAWPECPELIHAEARRELEATQ
jgi:cell division protein FtsB